MSLILLLLLSILFQTIVGLRITHPASLQKEVLSPYYHRYGKQPPFNITARLVLADPPYYCDEIKNGEAVEGNVLLVYDEGLETTVLSILTISC
jgi:hypothetical protein